jgi:hypothetical protein
MPQVTESRPTLTQRLLYWSVFTAALILTVISIANTWRSIHKLPRYQYERLNRDEMGAAIERANKTRTQAVKRAQWLAACGYEFERSIYKQDLSDVPSKNITAVLQLLSQEKNGYAQLYTIAFELLALEREQASAEAKWNVIRSQIHALEKADFEHGQDQLYQHWARIFESLELSPGVACLAALRQIQFPHNAFLIFLDRQLCQVAAAVPADDGHAIHAVRSKWLSGALKEPAPLGFRAVAYERIRATHLVPETTVSDASKTLERQIQRERDAAYSIAFDGVSISVPQDSTRLGGIGVSIVWQIIAVLLIVASAVATAMRSQPCSFTIGQLVILLIAVTVLSIGLVSMGLLVSDPDATLKAVYDHTRQDLSDRTVVDLIWRLPLILILLQALVIGILAAVAARLFANHVGLCQLLLAGALLGVLTAAISSWNGQQLEQQWERSIRTMADRHLGR